jgi:hypothetical protein
MRVLAGARKNRNEAIASIVGNQPTAEAIFLLPGEAEVMTHRTRIDTDRSTYTPDSDDRRAERREEQDGDASHRRWWRALLKPSEIIGIIALIGVLLNTLGFRYQPASHELALEQVARLQADSLLTAGLREANSRINALSYQQTLTNYLLCSERPRKDAATGHDECLKVLQEWDARR